MKPVLPDADTETFAPLHASTTVTAPVTVIVLPAHGSVGVGVGGVVGVVGELPPLLQAINNIKKEINTAAVLINSFSCFVFIDLIMVYDENEIFTFWVACTVQKSLNQNYSVEYYQNLRLIKGFLHMAQ